jgi:hypothetical protein
MGNGKWEMVDGKWEMRDAGDEARDWKGVNNEAKYFE